MTRSATSLRSLLQLEPPDHLGAAQTYADYCREERNFAAILYAQLLRPEGLRAFLACIKGLGPIDQPDRAEVFFEYAHARDLWHRFGKQFDNKSPSANDQRQEAYRRAIHALIDAPPGLRDVTGSIAEFNRFFIGESRKSVSEESIQMPNNWNQRQFDFWVRIALEKAWYTEQDHARHFEERICRLKWAFNAKADIVIHLPNERAVCVEIKVDSKESSYTASNEATNASASFSMNQTALQRYVLETLLGYQTCCVFLTRKAAPRKKPVIPDSPQWLNWQQVLTALPQRPDELPFCGRMLKSDVLRP